jgi:hypothetical protein
VAQQSLLEEHNSFFVSVITGVTLKRRKDQNVATVSPSALIQICCVAIQISNVILVVNLSFSSVFTKRLENPTL